MSRILLRGGHVHAATDPLATALAVHDGLVVWTGDDDAADHFADDADRVVELDGRLVSPAFVDAHVHLAQAGLAATSADLIGATSKQEALDRLAGLARGSAAAVIMGHGWDETAWADPTPISGDELAVAVGGRPAYVTRIDLHSAIATGLAGAHGRVERDEHHDVRRALFEAIPPADRSVAIRLALETAASHGIAMVHELGAPHISPETDFDLINELGGPLPEVVGYWADLDVSVAVRRGLAGAAGDLCMDGAIGSRTAGLAAPYTDAPDTSGHVYLTAAQVARHVVACTEAGIQAGFHVIGDRAVSELVEGFRVAAGIVGGPALVRARHRLEHLEMVTPEQLGLLGGLGVTASVQPMFDRLWGAPGALYERRLGERARAMNPFAGIRHAGMPLAFGSDVPVTPFGPWAAVRAAAWHHDASQRLSVRAAFDAHTRGGWCAARRDRGGVIAVGAPASLAVFDVPGDLLPAGPRLPELHPDQPLPTCVLTLVHGEVAYDAEGALV